MSAYPGGISKSELEIRIKRLQGEINRLLKQRVSSEARTIAVQIAGEALDSLLWNDIGGKPAQFPPEPHTHAESDITDLDKYTQAQVDALIAGVQFDLTDFNGGVADDIYVGLLADGGDTASPVFTGGIADGGSA